MKYISENVAWNLKLIISQRNLLFQELHFQAFQGCSISNLQILQIFEAPAPWAF